MQKWSTSSSNAAEQFATKVTPFQVVPVKESQENLVIGWSFVENLARGRYVPTYIGIHAYRSFITPKTKELIKPYPGKKMKAVLFKNGTCSILKENNKHVDVLFDDHDRFLKVVDAKFNTVKLVPMQVPPLRNCQNNEMAHERVNQLNVKLNEYSKNRGKLDATVVPNNDVMLNLQEI